METIPPVLKIGALDYEVILIDELPERCGDTDFSTQIIRLEGKSTPESQELSLLHEIIHAFNSEISETEVDWLAHAFHQVLTENDLYFYKSPKVKVIA